jgi:hypothetical protein
MYFMNKTITKSFIIFFALAAVCFFAGNAFADFNVIGLKYIADDSAVSSGQVEWDKDAIPDPTGGDGDEQWIKSTTYLEIELPTALTATQVIRIYTDNKNEANPTYRYYGYEPDNFTGLVSKMSQARPNDPTLPMSWGILPADDKADLATIGVRPYNDGDPSALWTPARALKDKEQTVFVDAEEYIQMITSAGWAQGSNRWTPNSGTFYIFFGANFQNRVLGINYGCDTITIEQYTLSN